MELTKHQFPRYFARREGRLSVAQGFLFDAAGFQLNMVKARRCEYANNESTYFPYTKVLIVPIILTQFL